MSELTMEIDLPAPPERVWAVLTDFATYKDWNPYQLIAGRAEHLSVVSVSSRDLDGRALPKARAAIWKFEPNTKLEFLSGTPLWFSAMRFFHLSPSERGTLLSHGVRFAGMRARWRFSHGHRIERLKPIYTELERALVNRVSDGRQTPSLSTNRHSRRAFKAKTR